MTSTSESVPLRTSHSPSASRRPSTSSSSAEEDDFADLDPNPNHSPNGMHHYNGRRRWPWATKFRRIISGEGRMGENGARWQRDEVRWKNGKGTGNKKKGLRGCCWRWRWCVLATGVVVVSVAVVLSGGAWWVMGVAPEDGLSPPWYPSPQGGTVEAWRGSYEKAGKMVGGMGVVDLVNVTSGVGWSQDMCVGNTAPANSVGFPALCLQDGPLGLRFMDHSTAFPAGITLGATWNKDLMYKRGRAHGLEAKGKGINVLLGPAMGPLGRMPAGGRVWEGFGSDPVLQGVAAAQTIKGIQDEGVMATAKHFIGNEQEHFRQSFEWGLPNALSSNIDDRTLHEFYLWPFAESVRAGVASVMCSYNMVNNSYACGNSKLLNGILKDELGFQGFVQSDWLAQRSGVASALAGLDMTMPGDGLRWNDGKSLWGSQLTKAVLNGSVPMPRINDMVTRVVAAWYQLKQDNTTAWPPPPPNGTGGPNFSSWTNDKIGKIHQGSDDPTTGVVNQFIDVQGTRNRSHGHLAKQIAAEGTILVKNIDNILPLSRKGAHASSGSKYRIGIFGEDATSNPAGPNDCPDRSCNVGTLGSGWGSGAVEFPYLVPPIEALISSFSNTTVSLTKQLSNTLPAKIPRSLLSEQDLCLVFISAIAGEGFESWSGIRADRNDLFANKDGDSLVQSVASACGGPVIVIIHAVGPVILENWIDNPSIKGVLLANLPGQESGNALASVLFGDVDASGRLPYTVPKDIQDYGPGGQILYYPNGVVPQQDFNESVFVDYRYFDAYNKTPRYPFGYGLSYTTFTFTKGTITDLNPRSPFPAPRLNTTISPPAYSTDIPDPKEALFPKGFRKLKNRIYPYISSTKDVHKRKYPYPKGYDTVQPPSPAGGAEGGNPDLYTPLFSASVTVTNTGNRTGSQVVQLYINMPEGVVDSSTGDAIDFPPWQLRAFEKVEIKAGKSVAVKMNVTRKDVSYWSRGWGNWIVPDGDVVVGVGRDSRDLPVKGLWRG